MKFRNLVVFSSLFVGSLALANGPDQMVTDVSCGNGSHLPSGLSLVVQSGGFAGLTMVKLTNRDGLGPFVAFPAIIVTKQPVDPRRLGAPVVYTGKDFELTINVDGAPSPDGIYSHVYADVNGRVFNQPMYCNFLVHTMNR